jgi:Activator of Hsp90 ATPase homolog 1-like protein
VDKRVDKTLKITTPSDLEFAMTREFDAPRHLVFDAMTRAEHFPRWFECEAFALPVCEIDLRVGGAYRFVMRSAAGIESTLHGTYLEVADPTVSRSPSGFPCRDSPATNTGLHRPLSKPGAGPR